MLKGNHGIKILSSNCTKYGGYFQHIDGEYQTKEENQSRIRTIDQPFLCYFVNGFPGCFPL